MSAPAWLSKKLDDGRILCEACHQHCKLSEGEYGVCGIRKVEGGQLQLLTYGLAAAVNVDPVEKKPMFHFLPDTKAFSFGTVGCNFACKFCQNADISQYPKEHDHKIAGQPLSPEQIVALAKEYGCDSIAYTYNEPVVFFEYTYDTAKLAHEAGLKNIYVTSGFETHKAIDTLLPYLDGMNIDIKGYTEAFYEDICGAKLKPVLDTVKYAHDKGIWIEITTLLIPGKNDSDEEIRKIARFVADLDVNIPWHVSGFYPMYKMLDTPPTPPTTLIRAYEIGKEEGLNFVYIGNYDDEDRESTYCPNCGFKIINRSGHIGQYVQNHLTDEGNCPQCGTHIPGVWE
ncbi:AmmeMemoRadiSam system radical SAM enzyme [Sulfurimonas diazotrophicus]|uniref:AmmeMemoRadiSam system radical SAM enzyme n=1 Tax=Sulfurimonas diazotrophicus TaxID=3131939 RepID=A0ABZ3H9B5_9BACT